MVPLLSIHIYIDRHPQPQTKMYRRLSNRYNFSLYFVHVLNLVYKDML